jgi:hypothetical protein
MIEEELESFEGGAQGGEPVRLPIAGDYLHKNDFTGGAWFRAYMAKVKELGDWRAGGFRRVSGTQSYPEEFARRLAADLLDI